MWGSEPSGHILATVVVYIYIHIGRDRGCGSGTAHQHIQQGDNELPTAISSGFRALDLGNERHGTGADDDVVYGDIEHDTVDDNKQFHHHGNAEAC